MGQVGVRTDKNRVKEVRNVDLVTPHGTTITVTAGRAAALLARPSIRMGDGVARTYAPAGEDNIEDAPVSGATPPRKGDRVNTKDDGKV